MAQFKSEIEYHKSLEKERRIAHNLYIDSVVKESIKEMICDCGETNSFKQVKRGSYIIKCKASQDRFKLVN